MGKEVNEDKAVELNIPAALYDSLMARLDNLASCRECVHVGAVIGREFSISFLSRILSIPASEIVDNIELLIQSEILVRSNYLKEENYVFKHALIQDVAYENILKEHRRELHARVAEVYENYYSETAEVEPETLAFHYTRAGMAEQAVSYWIRAGTRAIKSSSYVELINHLRSGLSLLGMISDQQSRAEQELEIQLLLGTASRAIYGFASREVEVAFSRAHELCMQLGKEDKITDVLRGLFACFYVRGEHNKAFKQSDIILSRAEKTEDNNDLMLGRWMKGCILFWRGDFLRARTELQHARSLYKRSESDKRLLASQIDPGVNALIHLTWTLWILGYPEQAANTTGQAVQSSRDLNQPFALAMALWFGCATHLCCGDFDNAEKLNTELLQVTSEHGIMYLNYSGLLLQGFIQVEKENVDPGTELINEAWEKMQNQKAYLGRPCTLSFIVQACIRNAKFDEGLMLLDQALKSCSANGEFHWEAELHRLKSEILIEKTDVNNVDVKAGLFRSLNTAQRQGAMSLALRSAMSLSRVFIRENNITEARNVINESYSWFTEGFETRDLKQAMLLIEELNA